MGTQINPSETPFRIGTEGGGDCGPWEWPHNSGRLFMLGKRVSGTQNAQVWYSTDNGASWAEADSANRPSGIHASDFAVGVVGCTVGDTIYLAYHTLVPAINVTAFSMDTLSYGRTLTGGPIAEPNFSTYECLCAVVPLPGERVRVLYLNDSPSFSYNTKFVDLDVVTGSWGSEIQINVTDNNSHYPYGLYLGAAGRTHAFYYDDQNDIGYERTIDESGALGTEQAIFTPSGILSKRGFGLGHSLYNPSVASVEMIVPYLGDVVSSPSNHWPVKVARAESAAVPSWVIEEVSVDPTYVPAAGTVTDGAVASACFFGHLHSAHVMHVGQAVSSLPYTAGELDVFHRRSAGSWGASEAVADAGGSLDVTSVRMRPISSGLAVLYVVDYTDVFFTELPLSFCTG